MSQTAQIFPKTTVSVERAGPVAAPPITRIGEPETKILLALARYHRLTAVQLTRLLYRPTSLTTVQARLKRMTDAGLLGRDFPHGPQRAGGAPWIYYLERKGNAFVEELGIEMPRFRPEEGRHGFLFYEHTLLLNDILIHIDLLSQQVGPVEIDTLWHERWLKQRPLVVEVAMKGPKGERERFETVKLIPDAIVDLHVHDETNPYRMNLAIEADRATEDQRKWRRKIGAYLAAMQGSYQEAFGTRSLKVAVATTGGDLRVQQLRRWTETELRDRGADGIGQLFAIAAVPAQWEEVEPADFLMGSRWHHPFGQRPLPLVTLEVSDDT